MKTEHAAEELSMIKKIMEDSRKINIDNGIHFIFWGILVTISLVATYVMIKTRTSGQYIGITWLALMIGGAIIDAVIGWKQNRSSRVETFAGKLIGTLWLGSGISMFIFGFVGPMFEAYNPIYICPIISVSLGLSYFTSGAIQQLRWLQLVAAGWWIGGILLFMYPGHHTLLIFAAMIVALQIVPGIVIRMKAKKNFDLQPIQ